MQSNSRQRKVAGSDELTWAFQLLIECMRSLSFVYSLVGMMNARQGFGWRL